MGSHVLGISPKTTTMAGGGTTTHMMGDADPSPSLAWFAHQQQMWRYAPHLPQATSKKEGNVLNDTVTHGGGSHGISDAHRRRIRPDEERPIGPRNREHGFHLDATQYAR